MAWWSFLEGDVLKIIIAVCLILIGGLFAGLTLGLMSLDTVGLEILVDCGNESEKKYAKRIQPIRKRGNLLLVTLLLANTAVNEALPLVVDDVSFLKGWPSFVVPTVSVMLFGEIIPQSICQRYGLMIGAYATPLVWVAIVVFFPIAFPISAILDCLLGQELGEIYTRQELKGLIGLHSRNKYGVLNDDETTIIQGALTFSETLAQDIMTPLERTLMLSTKRALDRDVMKSLLAAGHSRVPVYDGDENNVVAVLLVKNLILYNPEDGVEVGTIIETDPKATRKPHFVSAKTPLDILLNSFQSTQTHLGIVVDTPFTPEDPSKEDAVVAADHEASLFADVTEASSERPKVLGCVTLEDIVEEIIQEEIEDETDRTVQPGTLARPGLNNLQRHMSIQNIPVGSWAASNLQGQPAVTVVSRTAVTRIRGTNSVTIASHGNPVLSPEAGPEGASIRVHGGVRPGNTTISVAPQANNRRKRSKSMMATLGGTSKSNANDRPSSLRLQRDSDEGIVGEMSPADYHAMEEGQGPSSR